MKTLTKEPARIAVKSAIEAEVEALLANWKKESASSGTYECACLLASAHLVEDVLKQNPGHAEVLIASEVLRQMLVKMIDFACEKRLKETNTK